MKKQFRKVFIYLLLRMILKKKFHFMENVREHYNCLRGCKSNVNRYIHHYETLRYEKKKKKKNIQNCAQSFKL